MNTQYVNQTNIPLSLAVFLATDDYDYDHDPNHISATALIKPVRQLILSSRVPQESNVVELASMLASRLGTAIHNGIHNAWTTSYMTAMKSLGYPNKVIDRLRINYPKEELTEDCIPIYLEQRKTRQVGNYTVTGKFDFVGDGRVEDFKTTSVYSAMQGNNDEKYILQGSIYRWLSPDIITKDEMAIQFLFTDWSAARTREPNYPQGRTQQKVFPLKSIQETEQYIRNKLDLITKYWDAPEEDIPHCRDQDLWRSDPVYKYYKNPAKTNRSTKNFDSRNAAYMFMATQGNLGIVVEKPGEVKACKFCSAFSLCSQKDSLIASGDLQL